MLHPPLFHHAVRLCVEEDGIRPFAKYGLHTVPQPQAAVWRRLVRTDIATAGPPEAWEDLIAEHEKDLLQWASAHQVLPPPEPL